MTLHTIMRRIPALTAGLLAMLLLAGCSSQPDDSSLASMEMDQRDPWEETNRQVFGFNMAIDTAVLEPAGKAYASLPKRAKTAVDNHLEWAGMPATAVNSTLQGKMENAALAGIHFLLNSLTLGFADLTEDDDDPVTRDFGQTLAAWHVPQGNYVMMPLLGPGTLRSHGGRLADGLMNPLGAVAGKTGEVVSTARAPLGAIAFRGDNAEQINAMKYDSLDPYSRMRSFWYQYRQGQLDSMAATAADDDAFDSFLEGSSQ